MSFLEPDDDADQAEKTASAIIFQKRVVGSLDAIKRGLAQVKNLEYAIAFLFIVILGLIVYLAFFRGASIAGGSAGAVVSEPSVGGSPSSGDRGRSHAKTRGKSR